MAGPGRDSKLTPDARQTILDSIASGIPRKYAAMRAGVGERTLREWIAKGKQGQSDELVAFVAAVQKAEADAIARNVALIQKAAVTTWQAAAWWLERRYPEEFATDAREIRQIRKELDELKQQRITKKPE